MAIEINKGIEPFEDRVDMTRNNPDRKPFGRSGNDGLDLAGEYTQPDYTTPVPVVEVVPPVTPPPAEKKFTHKLSNGTVLEAATMEEMASLIEKAVTQQAPPVPMEFEDKPLYVPYEFKPKELSLTEQANILNVWKENPQKAMRMLQEADLGADAATIIKMFQDTQTVLRQKLEEEAGADFLGECETYNATPANGKKLVDHIKSKGKPITKQNLLVAFNQLSATDKTLIRKVDDPPPAPGEELLDTPPPPAVVPSNQGLPEAAPTADKENFAREFASWPLRKQQEYFAQLKRG